MKGTLKCTTQLVYCDFSVNPAFGPTLPEQYNPVCPIQTHPANAVANSDTDHKFSKRFRRADDPSASDKNAKMMNSGRNEDGLIWGGWVEVEKDVSGPQAIPMVAHLGQTTWKSLSNGMTGNRKWSAAAM